MRLIRRLIPKKLSWQMMLIFLLIATLPYTVLSTISLNHMVQETNRESEEHIARSITSTGQVLNDHFRVINQTTKEMYRYSIYSDQGIRMNIQT